MGRVSFVTWAGGGNQPPAIALAEELASRGHVVRWIGFESQRERLEATGLGVSILAESSRRFGAVPPEERLKAVVSMVWTSPIQAQELEAVLRTHPADLVVVDCLMFTAMLALPKLVIPSVTLFHSSPGAFVAMVEDKGGMGPHMMTAFNAARTAAGLAPAGSGWELWSDHPTVVASIPELDPEGAVPPDTFRYFGPLAPSPTAAGEVTLPPGAAPLVVASLSTGAAFGDPLVRLQRIADAAAALDVRLLITCGPTADPAALRLPPNATAVAYADHGLVMPQAAVSVHHAGHGTLSAALAAGVQSLAMPNPAADQPYLAGRVVALGAGLRLDRDAAAPDITRALAELLEDPTYRAGAARLSRSIAALPGVGGAAGWLESLIL